MVERIKGETACQWLKEDLVKLSDKDRDIISYLYFHGDAQYGEIAQATGYKQSTVRNVIQKLKDHSIIFLSPFINPYSIGLDDYQLFFNIATPGEAYRKKFIKILSEMEQVAWILNLGGKYQLDVGVYVNNVHELRNFFSELSKNAGEIRYQKTLAANIWVSYFPPKFLGGKSFQPDHLICTKPEKVHLLDETDHLILSGLMDRDFKSFRQLSRDCQLPHSSLFYRLEQLKEKGVLLGFGYQINPLSTPHVSHLFLLEMKDTSKNVKKRLFEFGKAHPNISYLIENLGAWDFQVGARVADSREIAPLTQQIHQAFAEEIINIVSMPSYELEKLDIYPYRSFKKMAGQIKDNDCD